MKRALIGGAYYNAPNSALQDDMETEKIITPYQQQGFKMPMQLFLSTTMEVASKRRRMVELHESFVMPMDISSYDNDESMCLSMEYHYLLDLPTEMLAHIFSFLPLSDLCRTAEVCTSTYAVVRFYTLSVCTSHHQPFVIKCFSIHPMEASLLLFIPTLYPITIPTPWWLSPPSLFRHRV